MATGAGAPDFENGLARGSGEMQHSPDPFRSDRVSLLAFLSYHRKEGIRSICGPVRLSALTRNWMMAIKKQEFYEGAALHHLARGGLITSLRYEPPFFIVNNKLLVCLKYSTKGRSPWGFTFMPDEQSLLRKRAKGSELIIGLICGSDGIAAISYDAYEEIAGLRKSSIHLSCYRQHGQHYAVAGPDGELDRKIPPSLWQRILEN